MVRWPILAGLLALLGGCGEPVPTAAQIPPPLDSELVYLGFPADLPQTILDAFSNEYGVTVRCVGYESPEESAELVRVGGDYDLVSVENQLVPTLAAEGMLAEIDWGSVPNFKNVSAGFRDLAIDPGNRYSVAATYGTTALLVRTDLVGDGVGRWSHLWDPQYAGKIGLRAQPREIIGMTLSSLGYALNSENPQELDAVLERLLELRRAIVMADIEASDGVPRLLRGEIAILHGYAEDYRMAHEANPAIAHVLPREGTALWGESYAIPAKSRRKHTAAVFLNFLLRADIAAQMVEEMGYARPNDAALPLIEPGVRDDPVVYPPIEHLRSAHLILPLSSEGERRYAELWARFVAAPPGGAQ